MKKPRYIVSLDVETVGLYGQPFAWAVVVYDLETRDVVGEVVTVCPLDAAMGPSDDREWVRDNVLTALKTAPPADPNLRPAIFREVPRVEDLLNAFLVLWNSWSEKEAWLLVDHGYPVETNFLFECFMEAFQRGRTFAAPYPVLDYASMRAGIGDDPLETLPRLESELPVHNPLADARHTLRLALLPIVAYNLRR